MNSFSHISKLIDDASDWQEGSGKTENKPVVKISLQRRVLQKVRKFFRKSDSKTKVPDHLRDDLGLPSKRRVFESPLQFWHH